MRYSDVANRRFCVSFLFRYMKKRSFFTAFTFIKNNSNHIIAKEKIQRYKYYTCKCRFPQRFLLTLFCMEASICRAIWKWSGETCFPGAHSTLLENFCRSNLCRVYFISTFTPLLVMSLVACECVLYRRSYICKGYNIQVHIWAFRSVCGFLFILENKSVG